MTILFFLVAGILVVPLWLCVWHYAYGFFTAGKHFTEKVNRERAYNEWKHNVYQWISIGMSYAEIKGRLNEGELVAEELIQGNIHKATYVWYFGWYTAGVTEGDTHSSGYTSVSGYVGRSDSHLSGKTSGYSETTNRHRQKRFIKLIFENDKLVSKEQQGFLVQ